MRSFEGQFASKKKVDLRGRSRVEESREQVLIVHCFLRLCLPSREACCEH
jgi:hypothetical protein